MSKEEKTYIRWYEGRTFRNVTCENNITYRLEELKHGRVYVTWFSPRRKQTERTGCDLSQVFKFFKEGKWILYE